MLKLLEFFGFTILTKSQLHEIKTNAQDRAVADLVSLLRKSDKIFLEPVTLIGDNQIIQYCTFLGVQGNALTLKSSEKVID